MEMITVILTKIDDVLYYPILLILLCVAGVYFSFRTRFIQIRLFPEAWRVIMEKPEEDGAVSSFQALMVSTASRVGTGNIIGVSTAICLGGPGAAFWMWLLAILGGASAFVETTLAQIYKRRNENGVGGYGGPAYYIENVLHSKFFAALFTIFLILTYGFGFNLLCSYNLQSTFEVYSFYNPNTTPILVGALLAIVVGICLLGGGNRIIHVTEVLVPFMGIAYVAMALIIMVMHVTYLPHVFAMIFQDAFNFRAILSGIGGSCMIYGIKRGLYSNEAGVGSAPNAAASADVSHPVKQGLVAVVSVCIDTLFLCSASAFMCLTSGVEPTPGIAGAAYVQLSMQRSLGNFGPIFITVAMVLFAFTTLIGNLYYVDKGVAYLNGKKTPGKKFMNVMHIICAVIVFVGAIASMDACWALADITMGGMTLINIPACFLLSGTAIKCAKDYEKQKREGKDPVFHAKDIDMDTADLDFWKD